MFPFLWIYIGFNILLVKELNQHCHRRNLQVVLKVSSTLIFAIFYDLSN
jgi:hypothetical protein